MIYLFLLLLIIAGIYIYDIKLYRKNKQEYYYFVLFLLSLTSGLSYRLGTDMINYMVFYEDYSSLLEIDSMDYFTSFEDAQPLWVLFVSLFRTFGLPFVCFHLFQTLFINFAVGFVVKKYSNNIFTCILLYTVTLFPSFNYEVMRESFAIAVFLFALPYFIRRDYLKFYILAFLAFGFHLSAFVLFLLPLVNIIPQNKLGIAFAVGFALSVLLFSDLFASQLLVLLDMDLFSSKAYDYFYDEKYSSSILSVSFLFNIVFYIIFPCYLYLKYLENNDINKILIFRLIIVYMFIYCCTLVVPIFYRINNYFTIFLLIYFADLLSIQKIFPKLSSKFSKRFGYFFIMFFFLLKIQIFFSPLYEGTSLPSYLRYYPYSSIFTKEINRDREKLYLY